MVSLLQDSVPDLIKEETNLPGNANTDRKGERPMTSMRAAGWGL
jgi:hypothetical protein